MSVKSTAKTFVGEVNFSGTTIAGLTLNSLTTTQRDALTASNGALIYNTTTSTFQKYNSGWIEIASTTGNTVIGGYLRVGSTSAPVNTTAGDITGLRLNLGNQAFGTSNGRFVSVLGTMTDTSATATAFARMENTIAPVSNSGSEYRSFSFANVLNAPSGVTLGTVEALSVGNSIGGTQDGAIAAVYGAIINGIALSSASVATAGTISTLTGLRIITHTRSSGSSTVAVTTGIGIESAITINGGGFSFTDYTHHKISNISADSVTTQIGIDIAALTRASTDIGIRIAKADTYTLQLSDTGGTAAGGITFGTDTTLYRSAADTLKTDDSLVVTGTLTAGTYTGQTSITTLGTITAGTWTASSISTTYTDAKVKTVTGTVNRLTIGGTATDPTFDISSSYVGQNTITTLGTITTGTWTGTTIAVANGGTGQTSYTDGQLLIGNTSGNTLTKATLTGTSNQVTVTNGNGSITLSTPQNIHTGASPTFVGLTLTGTLSVAKTASFTTEVDNGNSGTSKTIDWTQGNKQKITLTGVCTFTFTNPAGPASLIFKLIQDGTGSKTVTWPSVRWPGGVAPTLTTTASATDIVALYFDGTNYYGNASLNFS